MNYYIGQKLYFVPKNGEKKEITITKIGRKYLESEGVKINEKMDNRLVSKAFI